MNNKINEKHRLVEVINKFDNKNEPLILLFDKTRRKDKYKTYQITLEESMFKKITKAYYDYLLEIISQKEIEEYDFELNSKGNIQKLNSNIVTESENVNSKMSVDIRDAITVNKETDFSVFDFIAIRFFYVDNDETKTLTLYSKYKQPANKFKKTFKCSFLDNQIKELKSDILYFDNIVDAFEVNGTYYIINEDQFNSMFDFTEGFSHIIESKREDIINSDFIDKPEEFIDLCKNDRRLNKRLCKVIANDGFTYLKKGRDRLSDFIKEYKIPLQIDDKNIIKHKNKDDITKILNMLLKCYVEEGLLGEKMLSKGVEKYIS
ncbi:MAG: DUF4868 domain-containing protein [Tepidibacter sp.]|uniref:Kiwa anti-phage protein KwaB-like domain-containing protein n=1 Tax=Tepidibacter sp. TaxID=2529387 RepID=UPI0025FCCCEB|nr:Kiwa anti-phage protein KwaB-like domain-containing protein [Tepidibacter sp.]MCT4508259.1 DUF4868 domain-containing protein [Tepidibacter sp.]